jgi:2-keto-4-pentenoate hydratase
MHTPRELASCLWNEHLRRTPFHSIEKLLESTRPEAAYAVQDELVQLMIPTEGPTVGYKIGLTSLRMREMCGLDTPVAGVILARRVHRGAARVPLAGFARLGVESELCVILGKDLPLRDSRYSLEEIGFAVGSVAAAFELVDDRGADYRVLDALSLIADNSWNAGVVLAEPAPPRDLGALEGTLHINGECADSGNSRDALSHPLAVVEWLTQHLRARGAWLKAGDLVMTGSIVPTRFAKNGEQYRFELAGLSPAELWVS